MGKKKKILDLVRRNKRKLSLKEQALDRLERGGFVFPEEPKVSEEYLILPPTITNISDEDLGEYLNAFTQQKNWVLTLVGNLEAEHRELQTIYDEVYAEAYVNSVWDNVNDKKWAAVTDKKVKYWRRMLDKVATTLAIAERNLETLDNAIFLLSREVTRRTGLRESEIRNYNVSNIRRTSSS